MAIAVSHRFVPSGDLPVDPSGRYPLAIIVSYRFVPSGDLPVEAGRYRLVASGACPWCRRVLIARRLLGLTEAIPVSWSYGKGADGYWELTGPDGEPDPRQLLGPVSKQAATAEWWRRQRRQRQG